MSLTTRHVLVAAGGQPRLITEALYLLKALDGVVFNEIHVVAPPGGREEINRVLLDKPNGRSAFASACRRLRINRDDIVFNARTIHVHDVSSDCGAIPFGSFADAAFGVVRDLATEASTRLTVVVNAVDAATAAVLATTLQMVGRAGDTLYCIEEHPVLRDAIGRNRLRGFLFPDGDIKVGRTQVCKAQLLTRHEIPLVLLGLPAGADGHGYMALAKRQIRTNRMLSEPAALTVDLRRRQIQIDGTTVRISPSPFFWYAYLASTAPVGLSLSALDDSGPIDRSSQVTPTIKPLVAFFESIFPHRRGEWSDMLRGACGPEPGVRSTISKLNKSLRGTFGEAAFPYLVKGGRGATYRLDLSPARIRIVANA